MIPETITIPLRELIYFFSLVCPSMFIGFIVGIGLTAHNIRQAGYLMYWNKLIKRLVIEERLKSK